MEQFTPGTQLAGVLAGTGPQSPQLRLQRPTPGKGGASGRDGMTSHKQNQRNQGCWMPRGETSPGRIPVHKGRAATRKRAGPGWP